jgi:hypothetical protein
LCIKRGIHIPTNTPLPLILAVGFSGAGLVLADKAPEVTGTEHVHSKDRKARTICSAHKLANMYSMTYVLLRGSVTSG